MSDPETLALAERIAEAASALGIETAVIGAAALAVHKYVRATKDLDLACAVQPGSDLPKLERALVQAGLHAKLRLPDEHDPLGGVLVVWEHEDDDGDPIMPVELVNFFNPYRPRPNPGRLAIERATMIDGSSRLRCVSLADLVALKLYAGGFPDLVDIVQLLARNPDVDLDAVRATASPFDEKGRLEDLIAQAAELRGQAR